MLKLKDVAEKAGVSLSAVSRVLNNRDSLVSARTKARVLAIARELHYQPNHFAKSLKTGRTNIIGVSSGTESPLMEMFGQPYMTAICAGLGDVLTDQDYQLMFYRVKEQSDRGPRTSIMQTRLVDGLIFILLADFIDFFQKHKLPLLRAQKTPFVVITSLRQEFDFPSIGLDCAAGGRAAAMHFIEHGYRDFGVVTRQKPGIFYRDLQDGFTTTLREQGIPDEQVHVFTCDSVYVPHGYDLADRLLREKQKLPRAFFCVEDHLARGMMQRFQEAGRHVPSDAAFIGFGDMTNSNHYPNDLTSIRQPAHEKGAQAGRMLLEMLGRPAQAVRSLVMTPTLTMRQTCGCGKVRTSNVEVRTED
jgi:DNA-binding LacI/PurR family transcriptional regulator